MHPMPANRRWVTPLLPSTSLTVRTSGLPRRPSPMTRIALIPSSYPPALGGVEELTRHLALALSAAGDEVEVWTGHHDDRLAETAEIRDRLVVRRLPFPLPATNWPSVRRSATTGVETLFSLRSAVAAFRPDLLHVQCFGPNGVYATALSRLSGLPLVITLQGETVMDDADIFETSRVLRFSLRSAIRRASVVTGCSAFTLADAEARFGLGHGVDGWSRTVSTSTTNRGERPPRHHWRRSGSPICSRWESGREEGVRSPARRLCLARCDPARRGRPGDRRRRPRPCRPPRHAGELGVTDGVHFVGRLDRGEVADAMAGAEALVVPSRLEPFGIVILEGWRAGTAVVATNRGGPPELVRDGKDGVLVDPFDVSGFAGALEMLLGDATRRNAIARAGRKRVAAFAWSEVAGRYRALYAEVLPERRAVLHGGMQRADQGEWVR